MGWLEEGGPEKCQLELAAGLRKIGHPKPAKTGDQLQGCKQAVTGQEAPLISWASRTEAKNRSDLL